MAVTMRRRAPLTRRSFLSAAGATAAVGLLDGIAKPALSRAADRPVDHPRHPVGRRLGRFRHGLGARRPARAHAGRGRDHRQLQDHPQRRLRRRAAGNRLHRQGAARRICRPGRTSSIASASRTIRFPTVLGEPQVGRFRTAPSERRIGLVRLVGRHRRPGLGHRRGARRHAHLCDHGAMPARLLHPFAATTSMPTARSRRELQASERRDVEEPRHRREVQGRPDARGVPRQLQIQPARPQPARVQRRGADVRAMGRSRGHQRLVPGRAARLAAATPTRASSQLAARGCRAFHEFMPMRQTLAEAGRIYRKIPYGPLLDVFMLDMRSYRTPIGAGRRRQPRSSGRRRSPGSSAN